MDDLSAELQPLVRHERLGILYLAEDRRPFFAVHVASGPPHAERYTTDPERETRIPVAGSPLACGTLRRGS